MNVIRVLCQVFLVAAASGQGYVGHGRQEFDARRLQAGTFHYRESQVGTSQKMLRNRQTILNPHEIFSKEENRTGTLDRLVNGAMTPKTNDRSI